MQVNEPAGFPREVKGPLLFLIYINDLPNCLDISCAKMFTDTTNITIPDCTFAELEEATENYQSLQLAKSK